ncbi:hypothetical protein EPO05_02110 [Patescibacteria group bacterium]|nr:MAG: hypothetical protein EPO05_02110 [Patescibacteria group bacterium]
MEKPLVKCGQFQARLADIQARKGALDEALKKADNLDDLNRISSSQRVLWEEIAVLQRLVMHGEFLELVTREEEALQNFFGEEIRVPRLPKAVTPEMYHYWTKLGLQLHYLPEKKMGVQQSYPGWKIRPREDEFYQQYHVEGMDELGGGWIMVEKERQPKAGTAFFDDPLGPVLESLRSRGRIDSLVENQMTRFFVSGNELMRGEIRDSFAQALKVHFSQVHLPRAIEWNYLQNAFYPNWQYGPAEWLEDEIGPNAMLFGGGETIKDGLMGLGDVAIDNAHSDIGFRLLVLFE